jgi:cyclophilin family peptidyl-prolyl cis-trans isomerase
MPPKGKATPTAKKVSPAGKRPSLSTPAEKQGNPKVFFEINIDGVPSGRIEIELLADIVPQTAQNFKALCGVPVVPQEKNPKNKHVLQGTFKGGLIHRITDYMIQGGDVSATQDGKGQDSIYGPTFDDENFTILHDQPGIVSMANSGKNTNGSQFFITTKNTPWLDKRHVAFGKVVAGMNVVTAIAALLPEADPKSGRPKQKITIDGCGLVATPITPITAPEGLMQSVKLT